MSRDEVAQSFHLKPSMIAVGFCKAAELSQPLLYTLLPSVSHVCSFDHHVPVLAEAF